MISTLFAWAASPAGKAVGAFLAVFVVLASVYLKGRADGRASIEASLAADRVTILKDGREIDNATGLLDDDGLCAVIGGCAVPGGLPDAPGGD